MYFVLFQDDDIFLATRWNECLNYAIKDIRILRFKPSPITKPELVCRNEESITVEWQPLEIDKEKYPIVVYVVEILSSNNENWSPITKTRNSIVTVRGLVPGTKHRLRVRTVVSEGQLGDEVTSELITTLAKNADLQKVQQADITSSTVKGKTIEAILQWQPSIDMPCIYEVITWIPGREDVNSIEVKDPKKLYEVKLSALQLDTNYSLGVRAKTENSEESEPYWFNYQTPSCIQEYQWNLTLCAPEMPTKLSAHAAKNKDNNQLCDVYVFWGKPPATPLFYNVSITHYSFNPPPNGHRHEQLDVYKNVTGNETRATFIGLHGGPRFRVGVVAISSAGKSEEAKTYKNSCISAQSDGPNHSKISEDLPGQQPSWILVWFIAGLCLTTVLSSAILCVTLYRCRSRRRQELKRVQYFKKLDKGTSGCDDPKDKKHHPIDDEHEIPRERIIICYLLGTGAFGIVHKGLLTNGAGPPQEVAVKTLRDNPSGEEIRQLEKEISLMKSVGRHKHIVSMLGCCTRVTRPLLIIEFCELGDLQKFLRQTWKYKSTVQERKSYETPDSNVKYAELMTGTNRVSTSTSLSDSSYQSRPPVVTNRMYGMENDSIYIAASNITAADLLSFARQIAIGMEFLSNNRVVHRDLAARNVLVCSDLTVKISDFGLSRDIYEQNFYFKKGSERLPVKWMAIESFLHQIYTTQSDIWSFGVLLWEIVTLGGNPYPSTPTNQIFRLLKQGYRMERPSTCNQPLYEVMLACWAAKPKDRPTFTQLVERLDMLLEKLAPQEYLQLDADLLFTDHDDN